MSYCLGKSGTDRAQTLTVVHTIRVSEQNRTVHSAGSELAA